MQPHRARPTQRLRQGQATEAHLPSRRGRTTTSQGVARGDTSHCHPAACDVPSEVSWGQTGSPGWYPVPGRGACPQGTLSLVAENTATLSIPIPPAARSPLPAQACQYRLLSLPMAPSPPSASPAGSASSLLVPAIPNGPEATFLHPSPALI